MQTFLTHWSFTRTAEVLDYKRLGKQRVEAKQIYLALTRKSYGWQNHPAVKMWRGHECSLLVYGYAICREWRKRGFRDSLLPWFKRQLLRRTRSRKDMLLGPKWLNSRRFHLAHRSNLVRKDAAHYRKYFPRVKDNLPYIWPSK